MDTLKRCEEESPLLRAHPENSPIRGRSSSRDLDVIEEEQSVVEEEDAPTISTSRGVLIVGSVGFLIFLQGTPFTILTSIASFDFLLYFSHLLFHSRFVLSIQMYSFSSAYV
ncbi:hypothetical protein DM02DRAFT_615855 [Periconia macrospinosa]|uniref:MFS general substrate transporter n=1 Tax=Periconia macrospinosa TaxID=97972 RepID=A0A2V1DJQ2_9PLEO|nr:hypothetical protein DM02DRAFT_615855 [Periconia macrospinosa]